MRVALFSFLLGALAVTQASAQVGTNQGVLNPNLAGKEELAKVPHLGAELVEKIVAGRPFLGIEPLHKLLAESLSAEQLAEVYPKMFLPINLNTASKDEILRVPGVGKKMAHEFEEYRPWKNLGHFRREIGKYVDDQEVARLEQFVFVPLDLNTATDEQFKTIPGVGKKMAHEFEEYRPWKSMEQFRREIGKYVDDKEVARLERYVVIASDGEQ